MRAHPDYEPKPQITRINDDGSYDTLNPTQGWVHMTARRLAAQMKMAKMLDHVPMPRRYQAPKLYRKPAPVPPSTETRQQRRAAARGYQP